MLSIKVLGPGCANCKKVDSLTHKAVASFGVEASIEKITEYDDILAYDIISTPGLVINERVVCSGRVPSESEIVVWLADAMATA